MLFPQATKTYAHTYNMHTLVMAHHHDITRKQISGRDFISIHFISGKIPSEPQKKMHFSFMLKFICKYTGHKKYWYIRNHRALSPDKIWSLLNINHTPVNNGSFNFKKVRFTCNSVKQSLNTFEFFLQSIHSKYWQREIRKKKQKTLSRQPAETQSSLEMTDI